MIVAVSHALHTLCIVLHGIQDAVLACMQICLSMCQQQRRNANRARNKMGIKTLCLQTLHDHSKALLGFGRSCGLSHVWVKSSLR